MFSQLKKLFKKESGELPSELPKQLVKLDEQVTDTKTTIDKKKYVIDGYQLEFVQHIWIVRKQSFYIVDGKKKAFYKSVDCASTEDEALAIVRKRNMNK